MTMRSARSTRLARTPKNAVADDHAVIDASAMVDLLLGATIGAAVAERIDGAVLHAPAHLDSEVLSGLGRLHRDGRLPAVTVGRQLDVLVSAPVQRHPLTGLVVGAWRRRDRLRLVDALYVELAVALDVRLITTDVRLGRASRVADVVEA